MGRPKYISGISAFTDEGLGIVISYARDYGYDRIVDVQDITGDFETAGYPTLRYGIGEIAIVYQGILNGRNTRKIKVIFESGDSVELDLFVATAGQKIETPGIFTTSVVEGLSNFYNFSQRISYGPLKTQNPGAYAMLPMNDPYGRFGYSGAWSYSEAGSMAAFDAIHTPDLDTSVKFLGRPAAEPGIQFAQFVSVLGKGGQYTKASEVWEDALGQNNSQTVFAFVWTKDLTPISDGDLKRIEVCGDPTSPSYYRTTGLDSGGNTIPSYYLDGSKQAFFYSGACAIDPSNFNVWVDVRKTIEGSDGAISIKVVSNDATPPKYPWIERDAYSEAQYPSYPDIDNSNFIFDVVQPSGIGGTLTSGVVTQSTYTFSGLKESLTPYIIQVTDVSSGNKADIPVVIGTDPSRYCGCGIATAINYDGSASGDYCTCVDCSTGTLLVEGQPVPYSFMQVQQIVSINASDAVTADGQIVFNSQISQNILPTIDPFIYSPPPTYDIYLYSVAGYGVTPAGAPVQSYPANPTNDYTFSGILPGWYAIQINLTGQLCVTTFWVEVSYFQEKVPCEDPSAVSFAIDPCTGVVTASVDTEYEYVLGFLNNGASPLPSITVGEGDTFWIQVEYPNAKDCLETIYGPYTVTADDRNCAVGNKTFGCTDPTALNYDPTATVDAGTCVYGRFGCTDPTRPNYDPTATEDDGSCADVCPSGLVSGVTVSENVPTILFSTPQVNYTAVWYSPLEGTFYTTEDTEVGPYLENGAYVLTVTTSIGCTYTYVFSVTDPIYYGCMDPLALNFQPAANIPNLYYEGSGTLLSEECEYRIEQSKCVPKTLQTTLTNMQKCISKKSDEFVNNMKAGRLTPCTENDLRNLHIIYYLLSQRGLQCLYNCQDSQTPDPESLFCSTKWEKGGPSGEELIYDDAVTYQWGDVVKSPATGNIYVMINTSPVLASDPEDPYTTDDWRICTDTLVPAENVNRLDPILAKVKDICRECGISIDSPITERSQTVEDNSTTIGGSQISMNGDAIEL